MTQLSPFRSPSRFPSAAAVFGLFLAVFLLLSGGPASAVGALDAGDPSESAGPADGPETKTPIDYSPAAASPILKRNAHPLADTAAKLLLVLAAVFALFWILRRFRTPALNAAGQEGAFGIAALIPLTGKTRLALLRFGKKLLLVSASADHVRLLAETADPEEIETVLASLRRSAAPQKGGDS